MSSTPTTNGKRLKLGWLVAIAAVLVLGYWIVSETALLADKAPAEMEAPAPSAGVLARIGDHEIREQDVEETLAQQLQNLARQRHELLQQGLEQAIATKLIEIEAETLGMSSDELIAAEIEAKAAPVTEDSIKGFYEARKAQIKQPLEEISDRIREALEQQGQQERHSAYINELRDKYKPESFMEPMRIEVAADGPSEGPNDAPVTIVEFSDFQCPYCSRIVPTLKKVTEAYGDEVRLVFRQFPLRSIHPQAQKAAEASLCALDQGKFWEMHDALFESQRALQIADLKAAAADLGLEAAAFDECLDGDRYSEQVATDLSDGVAAGVTGTPAIFINGRFMSGAQPYDAIAKVIDEELRRAGAS